MKRSPCWFVFLHLLPPLSRGVLAPDRWPVERASAAVAQPGSISAGTRHGGAGDPGEGKVRGSIDVPANADKATLEQLALASEIAKWLDGAPPEG